MFNKSQIATLSHVTCNNASLGLVHITSRCHSFERGRLIGLKKTGWINRRIVRHLSQSDAAIRLCCQQWVKNGRYQRQKGSEIDREKTELCHSTGFVVINYSPYGLHTCVQHDPQRQLKERNSRSRRLPLTSVHRQV
ncbi:hypothetical protein TNCV_720381 [Trichonephila clavipes]|nr:hypothetical protein TNCV_720381 [Trichonephila clavipes]